MRVIIDERTLPKDSGDPYTKLYYALNNGIRKELNVNRDVVYKVHPLESNGSPTFFRRRMYSWAQSDTTTRMGTLPREGRPDTGQGQGRAGAGISR